MALLLTLVACLPTEAAEVEGIVLTDRGPVETSSVQAYRSAADLLARTNPIASGPGRKPGQFRLTLPAGRYYLTASGQTAEGKPLFAYHGLNPVTIGDDYQWIPFFVQPALAARCEAGFQGIGGRVLYKGAPLERGSVSVYTPDDAPFRGMGLLTNSLAEDGRFWFDLAPGSYLVVARQRQDSTSIGPLRQGDLFCYPAANPIAVGPAQACEVELSCYPRNDLEHYLTAGATDPRGQRQASRRDASLQKSDMQEAGRPEPGGPLAILAGRVTDLEGTPMPGLVVTAYPADDLPLFQMYILRFRSDFIVKTDSKGFFRLEVRPGLYYIVARERVGDAPIAGERYGLYEGSANHSLRVASGESQTGLQIVVEPIMP